jgi:transposase
MTTANVHTIRVSLNQGKRVFGSPESRSGSSSSKHKEVITNMESQWNPFEEFVACVGIDWASEHHDIQLLAAGGRKAEHSRISATPEGVAEWVAGLRGRFPAGRIAVAVEKSRGPLMAALTGYDFVVLYPIHPGAVKKFRDTLAASGAKSDPGDAALILQLLLGHGDHLRVWKPDTVLTRKIALLCEDRRSAVGEQVRLTAQLRDALKRYFPQALRWCAERLEAPAALALLEKWPTLPRLQRARPDSVRAYLRRHRRMSAEQVDALIAEIRAACVLTRDEAIVEAAVMKVKRLIRTLPVLAESIAEYERQIADCFDQHEDADLFRCLPGAGPALAPRLLALFGSDRERFESAEEVQNFSGIAPVTRASGNQRTVSKRIGCTKFLRQTLHEFAGESIMFCPWARAFYDFKRAAGKGHHVALRALAYKWARIIFRCWKDRTPYNEARYLRGLIRNDPPWLCGHYPAEPRPRPSIMQNVSKSC